MKLPAILALATALTIGGGAYAKRGAGTPEARPTGEAVNCISLSQIRESRVRGDRIVDFRVGGNKWYRNTLPHACPSLGFEERFMYQTSLSQLCSVDVITVLYGSPPTRGASCGLGKFQPVELIKKR